MSEVAYLRDEHAPHNVTAEQQVLGALLLYPERTGVVGAAGGRDLFYDPVHSDIFDMIARRERDGAHVSPVALNDEANGHPGMKDLGGGRYLVRLAGAAISPSEVSDYIDILADAKAKRDLLVRLAEAQAAIVKGGEPAGTIAGRLEASLIAADRAGGPKPVSMLKAVTTAVEQSWAAYNGDDGAAVHSGINALDQIVTGFYPGEMVLLGGRPSMGKTAVALSMALNVAREGQGVVICSLEMNPEAMALRAMSEATARAGQGISYAKMRRGDMAPQQIDALKSAAEEVAELPITFLPRQFADLGALYSGAKQARRILGEDNMKLLIVDYAQLLRSPQSSRYEQITEISIALKNLAGQLNVPVLALSQLSRAVEQRNDKRPTLADLRESGQLEQDADAVLFCYRDEYYLEREEPDLFHEPDKHDVWRSAMDAARHKLEIIVAKQRQGAIGTANVKCNPALNIVWED